MILIKLMSDTLCFTGTLIAVKSIVFANRSSIIESASLEYMGKGIIISLFKQKYDGILGIVYALFGYLINSFLLLVDEQYIMPYKLALIFGITVFATLIFVIIQIIKYCELKNYKSESQKEKYIDKKLDEHELSIAKIHQELSRISLGNKNKND